MDFYSKIKALSEKVEKLKPLIQTEEATKNGFVMPFINALGFDTFNPMEVVPEFIADLGLKKGEKVDYAIFMEDCPILIIECKHWNQDLNPHNSQLFRYFHVCKTRFSLLTNGITYKFYTDLEEPNKMDEKPFFEFDLSKIKDSQIKELEKFSKSNFNVEKILDSASTLKYVREIKNLISIELNNPSPEFVKHFTSRVYSGRLMPNVMEEFTDIVKKSFSQYISDSINERLSSALNKEVESQKEEEIYIAPKEDIETTDEEMEAYNIVLAILRRKLPKERISHRDTKSYFGVLLDDNNRKPICRLHLNTSNKYITVFDQNRVEIKEKIDSVDDIFKYEKFLLDIVAMYDGDNN